MSEIFTPLYDHILIQKDKKENTIGGNILLPANSTDETDRGTVIAVGHGRLMIDGSIVPMVLKVGDRVAINKMDGTEIKLNGVEYIITREPDIYGKLTK